jgi:hypothetical protein
LVLGTKQEGENTETFWRQCFSGLADDRRLRVKTFCHSSEVSKEDPECDNARKISGTQALSEPHNSTPPLRLATATVTFSRQMSTRVRTEVPQPEHQLLKNPTLS